MTSVGVVAHAKKRMGGGLAELRRTLAEYGITDLPWHEVPKSKHVPDRGRRAGRARGSTCSSCGAATAPCNARSTPSPASP